MKALILAGGFGTRLRPLTLSQPKPLVQFANKPMILHQIEALAEVGVDTVILAVNQKLAELLFEDMKQHEVRIGIKILFSIETEPLGTAGPLSLARHLLQDGGPFFVLNSDVICDFSFKEMMEFHLSHKCQGTIAVTKVEEPSKYGVVLYEDKINTSTPFGQIKQFVEKPQEYVGNKINAGMYILNPSILDLIPNKPCSIEKEIFPIIVENENLFAYTLPGFWMDIGMNLYLAHLNKNGHLQLATGDNIIPPVLIDPTANIAEGACIGPNVVIGANVHIKDGVRIQNATILSNTIIKNHSFISSSIIGLRCNIGMETKLFQIDFIGTWVRIENESVLGEDVVVNDELYLNGAQVLPHKSIVKNVPDSTIIM